MSAPPSDPLPTPDRKAGRSPLHGIRGQAAVMVGLSYAIDAALLAGYASLGTVTWLLFAAYVLAATAQCVGFHLAVRSGWSRRFADPGLSAAQMGVGSTIQVAFIAAAPQALPVFAFASFTLVAFGTLQLSMRGNLVAWAGIALGVGAAFLANDQRFDIPTDSAFARLLLVACFLLALLRCSFIGSFGRQIRETIYRRQLLAEASAVQLTELAQKDELTGALNRRGIMDLLDGARRRTKNGGAGFSLAMVDLDHFKRVNDAHGHLAGDEVLKMASQCIATALRSGDVMGRFGGEEFLVLLHGVSDPDAALRAAERVQRAFAEQTWSTVKPGLTQTASIGLSAHIPGERIEDTLARADAALYGCKAAGRNRVVMG